LSFEFIYLFIYLKSQIRSSFSYYSNLKSNKNLVLFANVEGCRNVKGKPLGWFAIGSRSYEIS